MPRDHRKRILEESVRDLAAGKETRNIDSVIAEWLERDLATCNGDEMAVIHGVLVDYVHKIHGLLPREQGTALRDMTDPILMVAYHAGMAGMAQLIAAKGMQRAGASTLAVLHDPANLDALVAIANDDLSVEEVADACSTDSIEQATRLLRLEHAGLAYRRHIGTKIAWTISPNFRPAVEMLDKQRKQDAAVEAALMVLSDLEGNAAKDAARALEQAFGAEASEALPYRSPT